MTHNTDASVYSSQEKLTSQTSKQENISLSFDDCNRSKINETPQRKTPEQHEKTNNTNYCCSSPVSIANNTRQHEETTTNMDTNDRNLDSTPTCENRNCMGGSSSSSSRAQAMRFRERARSLSCSPSHSLFGRHGSGGYLFGEGGAGSGSCGDGEYDGTSAVNNADLVLLQNERFKDIFPEACKQMEENLGRFIEQYRLDLSTSSSFIVSAAAAAASAANAAESQQIQLPHSDSQTSLASNPIAAAAAAVVASNKHLCAQNSITSHSTM